MIFAVLDCDLASNTMFKLLRFLHLSLLFYFLAFEFVNVKYTLFYIPVLQFHVWLKVVAFVPPS